jgi:sideroflexin-5
MSSSTEVSPFYSRFLNYVQMTDPRTLIYSDERVEQARQALQDPVACEALSPADRELNEKIVNAAIHPVTGEIIPRLFRVSAIAPVNIPLVFAMIQCPASNVPGTLFLHWLNQSYNTACNYSNRSGSEQSNESLMTAYGLAVTSACTLAYGLGKIVERGPRSLKRMGPLIPLLATSAANVSNIAFTRMDELRTGASLSDEFGDSQGLSPTAGFACVSQTALTRCVLVPASCLMFPPLIMTGLGKLNFLPASKALRVGIELGAIYLSLQAALPAALAVFPQTAQFPVEALEPKFHNIVDKFGNKIRFLYANKGL